MTKPSDHRLTIRLTGEERQKLEAIAGDQPLSAVARDLLFEKITKRRASRRPSIERTQLAKVMARLAGHQITRDFKNVSQQEESLDLSNETQAKIDECHDFLRDIRTLLLAALSGKSL